eukprot:s677_g10.t1
MLIIDRFGQQVTRWFNHEAKHLAESSRCEDAPAASSSSMVSPGFAGDGSDASASTRASSEEPPDEEKAKVAAGVKRLMEEMGWSREAWLLALDLEELGQI